MLLHEPGVGAWALWSVLYGVGGAVGSLISSFVGSLFFPDGGGLGVAVPLPQMVVGLVGTFILGATIGLAQWLMLRLYMYKVNWWPVVTGLGLALASGLIAIVLPTIFPLPATADPNYEQAAAIRDTVNGAIVGLMVGAAQAAILVRKVTDRTAIGIFVLTNMLGWLALALLASFLATAIGTMRELGDTRQTIILFLSFTLAGMISGLELINILKKHQQEIEEETSPNVHRPAPRSN